MNVISIENIWKEYRLGVIGHGTLTHDLQSWWAKLRGKEDPNKVISPLFKGQENQIEGDRFWAIRGVSFDIRLGEVLGIIGSNGAGKSTLLKILSRVTAPTKGNVYVKGTIASLLEVGTGFHPELTGKENIFMNGAILGMPRSEIQAKFDEIVDFSGVEQFIDTPVKRYSSGMYVRLAFAVAAHLEPEILIVDEVLAVGDAAFQKKCLGKMQDIASAGRTVIFVSHNMAAISSLCTKVVLLKNGELTFQGNTSEGVIDYFRNNSDEKNDQNIGSGDDFCVFQGASIQDENGKSRIEFELSDSIRIVMEYEILQKTKNKSVPNFHLLTAGGQHVACLNAPAIEPNTPGRYVAECIIPKWFLNEGAYSVGVAVTSYHECGERFTINFFEQNILSFNLIDHKEPDSWNYGYATSVPGIVRPRFEWKVKKIG